VLTKFFVRRFVRLPWLLALVLVPFGIAAQVNITQNRYDPQRTGANLVETILTPANVNPTSFGKLYSYPVDGTVYAQPLYMSGLSINGASRNVLFVATMDNKVYAFDADSPSATPLWSRSFGTPIPMTDILPVNTGNVIGNLGIQGTPVIDRATQTMYLVARTKEGDDYVQRLHAINILTGHGRPGSPVVITAMAPGTSGAFDSILVDGKRVILFDPKMHMQRPGLALTNGVVLISWGSHEDATPSHGWIMGYDAATLAQVGVFIVTPRSQLGAIWQSGRPPAIDGAGNAYFATGNGRFDDQIAEPKSYGDSLLKFSVSRSGLRLIDYFTPWNELDLRNNDDDLSGSGFTMIPGTNLLLGGGKEGVLYLLDANNLGHKVANDTQIPQKIAVNGGHVMGGPVYWNSASIGPMIYNWSEDDVLVAYRFSGGRLVIPPYAQGSVRSPGHPGGSLTVSASGSAAGTGIIWASMPTSGTAIHRVVPGTVRALNAESLFELWNSDQVPSRDKLGNLMKFVPPVVANGKVFVPNHDNRVQVYGLLSSADFSVSVTPGTRTVGPGGTATYSVTVAAQSGFTGQVSLSGSGGPSGTTISFNPQMLAGGGTSTMSVGIPSSASAGSFSLTVTATSGAIVRSANPVTITVGSTTAPIGAIGIDFVGAGTSMASTELAGVVAHANWNSALGATASAGLALVDDAGAATGARVTWTSANGWTTPITGTAGNARMMKGYLDTTATSTSTVTVTGLAPRGYDVYVYVDGDNGSSQRSGAYTISGAGITTTTVTAIDAASSNFSGTFVRASNSAGNYVKFTIGAGTFTLTATPGAAATSTRRAPVNGIQIVPAALSGVRPVAVDFAGTSTSAMASSERAGVVAQERWNRAVGATESAGLTLVDETGTATGARVTWTSTNGWMTPITATAGNARMMKGYLDTTATSTTTVTVTGLAPRGYDVYVYMDGDNGSSQRSGAYGISGTGITTTTVNAIDAPNGNFSGTFVQANGSAGNYVKFTISAGAFTLTATPGPASTTTRRAPINGLQIVPR
jgi:hypothetical protein